MDIFVPWYIMLHCEIVLIMFATKSVFMRSFNKYISTRRSTALSTRFFFVSDAWHFTYCVWINNTLMLYSLRALWRQKIFFLCNLNLVVTSFRAWQLPGQSNGVVLEYCLYLWWLLFQWSLWTDYMSVSLECFHMIVCFFNENSPDMEAAQSACQCAARMSSSLISFW
jgi:hypothetical protein